MGWIKCTFCGDEYQDFDVAHVCSSGKYAPKISVTPRVETPQVLWFCAGHGNVGIVRVVDPYDGVKYYIGQCSGRDEMSDIQHIADWGSTFPKAAGEVLFGEYN